MGQKIKTIKSDHLLCKTGIIIFWLLVWHLLALWVDNGILLVTPIQAVGALWELIGEVHFWQTIGMSLVRIGAGFVLGMSTALLLAALSSRFRLLEEVLSPVMTLCKAVPVASFVVLLLIWWGSSFLAVAICFLIVLPNIYISTLEGIKNTDKKLLEMATVFGMPFSTRFYYIYRPALKPFLDSSLKLSLGMCWKSGVAAEVIGTPDFSIGERLYMSKIYLDTAGVFAWTAVIILLSIGFERALLWLAGRFFTWEPACRECVRNAAVDGSNRYLQRKFVDGREQSARRTQKASKTHRTTGMEEPDKAEQIQLQINNIDKSFGSQQVITGFSASYKSSETYYLTSPSGSGKTTLLRLVAGLEQPDRGSIRFLSASPAERHPGLEQRTSRQKLGIFGQEQQNYEQEQRNFLSSMVFQEDRLCEEYSAIRNVEMITGSRKRAREALCRLLEEDALSKPCSRLSGGMKRRVALVRAMESISDVVLLDEPFTGMDADTRRRAEQYIQEKKQGRVLIIATHI